MRDLRFRAWHPEWDGMILSSFTPLFEKREFYLVEFCVGFSHFPTDNRWVIMQFTGLKDKHGKDIYEGDIIKVSDTDKVLPVIFMNGCFYTPHEKTDSNYRLGGWNTETISVIGNIYENKELLNP